MNDWFKILLGFKMGYFHMYYNGLTPRFLVGACQNPVGNPIESPELAKQVAETMFTDMKNFDNGEYMVISTYCPIHKGVVMNLSSQKKTDFAINSTFEEIWERYGSEIIAGDYHISSKEKEIVEQIFREL